MLIIVGMPVYSQTITGEVAKETTKNNRVYDMEISVHPLMD